MRHAIAPKPFSSQPKSASIGENYDPYATTAQARAALTHLREGNVAAFINDVSNPEMLKQMEMMPGGREALEKLFKDPKAFSELMKNPIASEHLKTAFGDSMTPKAFGDGFSGGFSDKGPGAEGPLNKAFSDALARYEHVPMPGFSGPRHAMEHDNRRGAAPRADFG